MSIDPECLSETNSVRVNGLNVFLAYIQILHAKDQLGLPHVIRYIGIYSFLQTISLFFFLHLSLFNLSIFNNVYNTLFIFFPSDKKTWSMIFEDSDSSYLCRDSSLNCITKISFA